MNTDVVIKAEGISKQYRLGLIGSGTLRDDISRFIAKVKGKEDPTLKIGAKNQLDSKGEEYVWALRDVNFSISKGEVVGIIGKNGAGKSTLLKILSKVTAPTTGSIKARGRIASLLEVGTGFHPELTGRENIFLNGAILGMTKAEIKSKLDEIIDFSGVAKYIDTPTKRYSSGMTVRLAFAVAAHLEPEILVVDEVLAVGDAEFQKKAIGKMQDVSRGEGRTVLFVSHNMAAVQSLCNRGIVMRQGTVVFDGGIGEAVDKYLENNRAAMQTDLALRTDRMGTKDVMVTHIYLTDEIGNQISEVKMGGFVSIHLVYKVNNPDVVSHAFNPAITIADTNEIRLLAHHPRIVGQTYRNISPEGEFIIRINSLPLPAGSYLLGYNIVMDNVTFTDNINNALQFEVIESDYYQSGYIPSANQTKFLLNAEWLIN